MHAAYVDYAPPRPAAAAARDEQRLLLQYAPLVKRTVRQLGAQVSATMSREDMEQIGLLGLLEALRRYGTPDDRFTAFASLRIRGAILDELRRQDWRPRTVRQESHRMRDAVRELTRRLGRQPSEAEIVASLGISTDDYQLHLQDENAEAFASFDELINELTHLPADRAGPEAEVMTRRSLERALLALDEREQRVIQMYYEHDLSLKEIAAVLQLTEARVCQINKAALAKMKAALTQP
jgi:RNA polymerase sigma factor for flagellar operon FliA